MFFFGDSSIVVYSAQNFKHSPSKCQALRKALGMQSRRQDLLVRKHTVQATRVAVALGAVPPDLF